MRVLARRERALYQKRGLGDLQWLVNLENSSATFGFFFINLKSFLFSFPFLVLQDFVFVTKKVVSVENLTGLFPSTWVTLVT